MNDTLIQDSIKVAGQAITKTTETGEQTNWWMWLAIVEFGIIAYLILREQIKPKDTAKQRFKHYQLPQLANAATN